MAPLGYSQPFAIPRQHSARNSKPWWEDFVQIARGDTRKIPSGVGIVFLTVNSDNWVPPPSGSYRLQ